ncbi:MAG: DUF169 domain-containing protein [Candidatus Sericytochromatia bacterium]|nr:DUF169 domain-containing protein [Candidatus Tanganyikabacteria bacterium]
MSTATFPELYRRYMAAFGTPDLPEIAAVGVKFVKHGDAAPPQAAPLDMAYTWCYALKQAAKGEVPLVTKETIGCMMAGIALGLIDEQDPDPLPGWRQYSQNMGTPPTPRDYREGLVFGCAAAGRQDLALYGADDVGRYLSVDAAKKAYQGMPKVQPATTAAVVAFPPDPELATIEPDVVILALTPRETLRTIQGLTFQTGERFESSTLGVGGFSVDLTSYPYVTGKPNASFLCVGARVVARWEGGLNGLGLPWSYFQSAVAGMEASATGYPFPRYPG